uniref:C2 domain-containing protein n=1 Tax=Strongyloides stercoralis TaxID=6248 RepID=A0A0K0E1L3_STRER
MFLLIIILIILIKNQVDCQYNNININSLNQDNFWITGEIISIKWKRGCLSSERCTNPRFQINSQLLDDPDIQRLDFPLTTANTRTISFNNYFSRGKPHLLTLSMKIVGTDPLYNIPLDCDKTINIRVFDIPSNDNEILLQEEEGRPSIVELQAKCFTAIIQIKKYELLCPWCLKIDKNNEKDNNNNNNLPISLPLGQLEITQTTFCYIISVLLLVIILSIMAIIFLFIRQRKLAKSEILPSNITIYPQSRPSSKIKIGINNDDGGYETIDEIDHLTVLPFYNRTRTPSSGYPSSQNSSTSIYRTNQCADINILTNYI